jgi:hypothetical protein
MKGFTKVPYIHAGFPKIDAVTKFRANVVGKLDEQQSVLDEKVRNFYGYQGPRNIQTQKNALNITKNRQSDIGFEAYFDRSAYKKIFTTINKEVTEAMEKAMEDALTDAAFMTVDQVVNMRRNFKGKYNSNKRTDRDLYDVIGNSLWWGRKSLESKNQFTSFFVGSYDEGQSYDEQPRGVTGSRGANLTELTAEGTGSFRIDSHPLGGTKRLVNHLKNARGG